MVYYCYILNNNTEKYNNRTYVGSTNNPKRRIRQHNREISGGAKSTKYCNEWMYCVLLSGFPDKINMLQCEWTIKHKKYYGKEGRIKSLCKTLNQEKWTKNSTIMNKDIKLELTILEKYKNIIEKELNENNNIIINYVDNINLLNDIIA
jgi:structure-specific endonuclease subunit SLX1